MERKGREIYSDKYEAAIKMNEEGKSIKEIAKELDVSYSAAYHWIKGLRKPEKGRTNDFIKYLELNGPSAVIDVKEKFSKHNEIFLTASKRGLKLKRKFLGREYGEYSTWYLLEGQENKLKEREEELKEVIKRVQKKLSRLQ